VRLKHVQDCGFLLILWAISVQLVGWQGNFPMNDDWSYSLTVKNWLETGEFRPLGWTSMTLISHAAWGALFCKIFGFSFETLRLSVLTLGALGQIGSYFLLLQMGGTRIQALIGALIVGFNPIFFDTSFTFMTDITFLTATIWALFYIVRYLQSGMTIDWLMAIILSLAAIMCRQVGLSLILGLALGMVLRPPHASGAWINPMLAILTIAIGFGSLIGFSAWLESTGRTPALYHVKEHLLHDLLRHPLTLIKTIWRNTIITLTYTGLFLSPFLLMWPQNQSDTQIHRHTKRYALVGTLLVLCTLGLMLAYRRIMPIWLNEIGTHGLGHTLLHDADVLHLAHVSQLPIWWWLAMTAATLAGVFMLATKLLPILVQDLQNVANSRSHADSMTRLILLTVAAIYIAPVLAIPEFWDRYLMLLVPIGLALLVTRSIDMKSTKFIMSGKVLAGTGIACYLGVLAIAGAHDHLAWNRARWAAIDFLEENVGAKSFEIDGGFEYNGLHSYNSSYKAQSGKSWWWVQGDSYLVAFDAFPGTTVLKRFNYPRWLSASSGEIVALERSTNISLAQPKTIIHP
jgi:hypothetical protein